MAPTELVTAAQEGLAITLVVPENHGYQVIHRLQMFRSGREFGNEFRYRTQPLDAGRRARGRPRRPVGGRLPRRRPGAGRGRPRRPGRRATTAAELREALDETRGHPGPVVIVVPAIPHADLPPRRGLVGRRPGRGLRVGRPSPPLRAEYEHDLAAQRWFG